MHPPPTGPPLVLRAERWLDVDAGEVRSPAVVAVEGVPAGQAITPTGGHLDPTMFQRFSPDILPLTVEEGNANGVSEVRKAVRYQIKYGARVIKISASGGHVARRPRRGPAVFGRGARGHRGRSASRRHDPSEDITTTQDVRSVMKGGRVYKMDGLNFR